MSAAIHTRVPAAARTFPRLRLGGAATGAISLTLGVLVWELIGRAFGLPFFPPFTTVLTTLVEMVGRGVILGNVAVSLSNLAIGFAISLLLGVVVGTAMGRYWRVRAALGVYVYALLTAPSLVFAPIFFSIFGAGQGSIVAVVIMYSAFVMIINTASAVQNVPTSMQEMGRSYGASEWQLLTRVVVPAALPTMMAGIRLGMGRAVLGMINGEMFIAVTGLGRLVTQAGKSFDGAAVLAVLLVIIVVALAAVGLVQMVDKALTSWVPDNSREK